MTETPIGPPSPTLSQIRAKLEPNPDGTFTPITGHEVRWLLDQNRFLVVANVERIYDAMSSIEDAIGDGTMAMWLQAHPTIADQLRQVLADLED